MLNMAEERAKLVQKYTFKACERAYIVKPFPAEYVFSDECREDMTLILLPTDNKNMRFLAQAMLLNNGSRAVIDKWLSKYCLCGDEYMSVEKAADHGWTLDDFALCVKLMAGVSD